MQMTVKQASGLVLDHLMNDPIIQQIMEQFISQLYPDHTFSQPDHLTETEWEHTAEYTLYYAATVEFHSKVLASAIMGLVQDPLNQ